MSTFILNGWGWTMPQPKKGTLTFEDLSEEEFVEETEGAISCIGNPILARLLELPYNPSYINLDVGDVALVINLRGGRIPVGTKEFPDDVTVKYTKVEIKEAASA